jgi:RHS repeat-associated protein
MEGNWNGAQGNNKYQYNNKEWNDDFGLGWNDYGARFYDAALTRWTTIDPLTEMYFRWSPYHYAKENPIRYIDPNGMCSLDGPLSAKRANEGHYIGSNSSKGGPGDPPTYSGGTLPELTVTANRTGVRSDGRTIDNNGNYVPKNNTSSTPSSAFAKGGAVIGTLVADDITGIGTIDDVLIPFVAVGTIAAAGYYAMSAKTIDFPVTIPSDYSTTDGINTDIKNGKITLFRGVHKNHPDYQNALLGIATPIGGHDDPLRHNLGDNKSVFTSWTTTPWTALSFANSSGLGGIILVKQFNATDITPSPDKFFQGEVLIRGIVTGAVPIPSPNID